MSKKKNKKEKVDKFKTKEERQNQVSEIKDKLQGLGLSKEMNGIDEFYKYCDIYIEEGIPWSGKIKLFGNV